MKTLGLFLPLVLSIMRLNAVPWCRKVLLSDAFISFNRSPELNLDSCSQQSAELNGTDAHLLVRTEQRQLLLNSVIFSSFQFVEVRVNGWDHYEILRLNMSSFVGSSGKPTGSDSYDIKVHITESKADGLLFSNLHAEISKDPATSLAVNPLRPEIYSCQFLGFTRTNTKDFLSVVAAGRSRWTLVDSCPNIKATIPTTTLPGNRERRVLDVPTEKHGPTIPNSGSSTTTYREKMTPLAGSHFEADKVNTRSQDVPPLTMSKERIPSVTEDEEDKMVLQSRTAALVSTILGVLALTVLAAACVALVKFHTCRAEEGQGNTYEGQSSVGPARGSTYDNPLPQF